MLVNVHKVMIVEVLGEIEDTEEEEVISVLLQEYLVIIVAVMVIWPEIVLNKKRHATFVVIRATLLGIVNKMTESAMDVANQDTFLVIVQMEKRTTENAIIVESLDISAMLVQKVAV